MQWLIIEDKDGAVENISLEGIEAISCSRDGITYVMRRGLPPKGFQPREIYIAAEPKLGAPGRLRG